MSREFGSVALLRGTLPRTPRTYAGQRRMGTGQRRFWSLCSGTIGTQTVGCLVDEELRPDRQGRFTVAVSTAADRPASAGPGCRIGWIPWGPDLRAIMIMRNMLPAPAFAQAVQRAQRGTEQQTLGPYLPTTRYYRDAAALDRGRDC